MARPLRIEFSGAIYQVTSRGNAGEDICLDDTDRAMFLGVLAEVISRRLVGRIFSSGQRVPISSADASIPESRENRLGKVEHCPPPQGQLIALQLSAREKRYAVPTLADRAGWQYHGYLAPL
jgi:hypothetical protein